MIELNNDMNNGLNILILKVIEIIFHLGNLKKKAE